MIKKRVLMFLFVFMGFLAVSAQRTITGKVTDSSGEPLSEVLISPTEGAGEAISDENGNYRIEVSDTAPTLLFEYVGEKQMEVPITGNVVNVVYAVSEKASKTEKTDQVVVTGFQKIDRKLFTGTADRIRAEDIVIAGVPDVSKSLQGLSAGVDVQNVSGTFGSAPRISIRGNASLNGTNKPLWVIDGVIQEDLINVNAEDFTSGNLNSILTSGVAGLNQDDIKDVQVLKDVSATALYGAQAMNGVIVITTKKGKSGKPSVSYSVNTIIRQSPDANDYDLLDSGSEIDIYREYYAKGLNQMTGLKRAKNYGVLGKMYELMNANVISNNQETGLNEEYLSYYANANTDWFEELFKTSISTQHSLSISGGSENSNYYASLGFYNDAGATISDRVKNYTALLKTDFKISDKFSAGFKLNANYRDQRVPGTRNRTFDPITGQYNRDFDINPFSYALNTSRAMTPYDQNGNLQFYRSNYAPFNILYELEHNYIDIGVKDMSLQTDLKYDITKNLVAKMTLQGRIANTLTEHKIHETANAAEAYRAGTKYGYSGEIETIRDINDFLYENPETPTAERSSILERGGFYNTIEDELRNYNVRTMLEWNPRIGDKHRFTSIIGNEIKYTNRYKRRNDGWGILYDRGGLVATSNMLQKYLNDNGLKQFEYTEFRDRFTGYFATAGYSYDNRYIINGSVRYDGSNQLGNTNSARWLPSWNVSAAWNVQQEAFMQGLTAINLLKLKATYGLTGVMGPNASAMLKLYGNIPLRPTSPDTEPGIEIKDLANKDLTWEKLRELNLGFELGLFNNRIFTEFNYYNRTSEDLIDFTLTSGIGGLNDYRYANVGTMKGEGVELTLRTKNIITENFEWSTQFTYGYNTTRITELENTARIADATQADGAALLGGPQRGLWSIRFAGLDEKGIPTFYDNKGAIVKDIDLQERDKIEDWLVYEGSVSPKGQGGIRNDFRIKNWNFGFNLVYRYGNKIRLGDVYQTDVYNQVQYYDYSSFSKDIADRWVLPGDENYTNIPGILYITENETLDANAYALYNLSDQRIAKGDFIKLKDIYLSYNLPQEWVKNAGISSLKLSFNVNNVALLYSDEKLNGVDPEFYNAGGVALPSQRIYTIGLNVNF